MPGAGILLVKVIRPLDRDSLMPTVRLACRDEDRAPVIFYSKDIEQRHYGVDVDVILSRSAIGGKHDAQNHRQRYFYRADPLGRGVAAIFGGFGNRARQKA
jgi:hypothetical protein